MSDRVNDHADADDRLDRADELEGGRIRRILDEE